MTGAHISLYTYMYVMSNGWHLEVSCMKLTEVYLSLHIVVYIHKLNIITAI